MTQTQATPTGALRRRSVTFSTCAPRPGRRLPFGQGTLPVGFYDDQVLPRLINVAGGFKIARTDARADLRGPDR